MLKNFKKSKKAEAEINMVLDSADRIDQLIKEISFDARTTSSWSKLQEELDLVAKAL
jgi:hypothetical protein